MKFGFFNSTLKYLDEIQIIKMEVTTNKNQSTQEQKLFLVVDNGEFEASKHLALTMQKAKIKRMFDVRTSAGNTKQIKEIANRMKVQYERSKISTSNSVAGLMGGVRGNVLLLVSEWKAQVFEDWQKKASASIMRVVPKNFNVKFEEISTKEEEVVGNLKKETPKRKRRKFERRPVVYETETGDPDDMFAIAYIVSRPEWELVGLTVNPGSKQQVQTMQALCNELQISPLIGSYDVKHPTARASGIWLQMVEDSLKNCSGIADGSGDEVYSRLLDQYGSELLIISGAPMNCMGHFFEKHPDAEIDLWVAQGGFAGDNIVAPEFRLQKFQGMTECPTFNFGGCKYSLDLLANQNIKKKILVSKNVCHGVIFNRDVLNMYEYKGNRGLDFIAKGMGIYLRKKSSGKKFHDPLACVVALCENLGMDQLLRFEQVEMYRERGKFGCVRSNTTNTFISTNMKCLVDFWRFFWQL